MAITFYPDHGTILMCDFNTGFKAPEMVKKRPVVVVSPRRNNSQLCTIVPLSTVPPTPILDHHHRMNLASMPDSLTEKESWAKCDMLMTVSLNRLDRVADGRGVNGKRKYVSMKITPDDFKAIRTGILFALGLNSLTEHLP